MKRNNIFTEVNVFFTKAYMITVGLLCGSTLVVKQEQHRLTRYLFTAKLVSLHTYLHIASVMELLMEDLGTSVYQETPPPTPENRNFSCSHGGPRDFASELTKNTPLKIELFMEDLETSVLSLPRILPPSRI